MPEFAQLESGKSIILYLPPKLTAGLATFSVRSSKRVPLPPARIIATIFLLIFIPP